MKHLILTLFSLALFSYSNKINVAERQTAMCIAPGYVVGDQDSVFYFNKRKYVILSREFFGEDGNITSGLLRKDMGYLEFTGQEIQSNNYEDFSKFINAAQLNAKQVKINSSVFVVSRIDKKNKKIYYKSQKQPQYLYCLIYR